MFFNRDRVMMVVHAYYIEDSRVRREAEALVESGKQVDVVCLNKGEEPKRQTFKGVNIHRLGVSRSKVRTKFSYIMEYLKFAFFALFKVSGLFMAIRPKVVFVHNMPNFLVFSALVPRLCGATVIIDMHDVMPELYANLFNIKGGFLAKLLLWEEKLSALFAAKRMTVNPVMCDILTSRVKRDYFILHNTPNDDCLTKRDPAPKCTDKFNLFYHGNIHERYGLGRMLPILKALNEQGPEPEYHLEIHGRGTFYDEIKKGVERLGIGAQCQLNGGFAPERVGDLLVNADLGIVPNFADEFANILEPVKLLEYVACKVPVVCPRLKAVEATFGDDCIFYFDDDEDLKQLIAKLKADPQLRQAQAERAYQRYLTIEWNSQKKRFLQMIEQL